LVSAEGAEGGARTAVNDGERVGQGKGVQLGRTADDKIDRRDGAVRCDVDLRAGSRRSGRLLLLASVCHTAGALDGGAYRQRPGSYRHSIPMKLPQVLSSLPSGPADNRIDAGDDAAAAAAGVFRSGIPFRRPSLG